MASIKDRIDNILDSLIEKVEDKDELIKLVEDGKNQDNLDFQLKRKAEKYGIEGFDEELDSILEEATIKRIERVFETKLDIERSFVDRIKETFETAKKEAERAAEEFDRTTYGIISVNNGAGSTTTAVNIALELSKKYRVCILDCNFPQPSVGITLSNPVVPEKSIMNYFNSSAEISDCVMDVKNKKNLWMVSTSPVDHPRDMADLDEELLRDLIKYLQKSFQYLILDLNYNPFAEWFVYALDYVDKAYFVWDEQIDNVIKTKAVLDYVHQISNKANNINNVILNKRTKFTFPYEKITEIECNLIAEIPYLHDLVVMKNEGKVYVGSDKRYNKSIGEIVEDIEDGQDMGGNKGA